jgi:hypothetical protein
MGNNSSAYSMYKNSRYINNGTIEPILSTIQDKSKQLEVENNIRVIKEKYANKSVINIVLYGTHLYRTQKSRKNCHPPKIPL